MCMSPDEMSDDRLREVIEYNQENLEQAQALVAAGDLSYARNVRLYEARISDFQALLDEREQERRADIDEVLGAVLAEATPERDPVLV